MARNSKVVDLSVLIGGLLTFMAATAGAYPLKSQRQGDFTWIPITTPEHDTRGFEHGDYVFFAVKSGVGAWDKRTKSLKLIPLDDGLATAEIHGMEMVKGMIWVISRKSGIYVFDPKSQRITGHMMVGEPLDEEHKFGYNGNMNAVFDQYANAIWFGHFVNVDRYDIETGAWKSLNLAIKEAGIGRLGSGPTFAVRKEGVWIFQQAWRDGNGKTLFCDHRAESCRLADSAPPPLEPEKLYKDCGASARFPIAVCGNQVVKKKGDNWDVLVNIESPFSYPINTLDPSYPVGPFIKCRGSEALVVVNGGMHLLNLVSLDIKAVKGGEGFSLSGSWGTQSEDEMLQISQEYDGCDEVPPPKYHSFNFKTLELSTQTTGGFSGYMEKQGLTCDIPGNLRIEATAAGLKIGKRPEGTPVKHGEPLLAPEFFEPYQ